MNSGQFKICLNCVCSIPDCESIALFHGLCFFHGNRKQLKNCHWCWTCDHIPLDIKLKNKDEYIYLLSLK